jgi:predicted Zn-dependent peptidase
VVTETMPQVRSIAISIVVDVGPKDEAPEQSGLAHLVEHLMFKGTSSRDAMQIARLMDVAGGMMGGFTSRDYTCYFATVLDDYRTYALDLFGDVILNSIFDEESLEREQGVILREIEADQDAPEQLAHNLLKATIWPNHPLGRLIAGRPEVVGKVTREDMIYFVHKHYGPDRLIIAAAGSVEHDDFVAQVRDAFWRMLGQGSPVLSSPPACHSGVIIRARDLSQLYFALGVKARSYTHPDRYGLHVLNDLLGGGISSRLFHHLREERGLVYNVASSYHAYRDGGLLVIEGSTTPQDLISVLGLTMAQLWRLAEEPVGEEELWKARERICSRHLIASEDTNTRMSRLATQELYFGYHIPATEIVEQIQRVDQRTVQRLAQELMANGCPALALVGPQSHRHYSAEAIEKLLTETSAQVQRKPRLFSRTGKPVPEMSLTCQGEEHDALLYSQP